MILPPPPLLPSLRLQLLWSSNILSRMELCTLPSIHRQKIPSMALCYSRNMYMETTSTLNK